MNAQTFSGRTPLHIAAAFGSAAIVNALLVAGALQGVCDANGFTAYDAALLRVNGAAAANTARPSAATAAALGMAKSVLLLLSDQHHPSGILSAHADLLARAQLETAMRAERVSAYKAAAARAATSVNDDAATPVARSTTDVAASPSHGNSPPSHHSPNGGAFTSDDEEAMMARMSAESNTVATAAASSLGVTGGGYGARAALIEARASAEDLQLPSIRDLVVAGVASLEVAAQGLQANLLALRAARDRHLLEDAWIAYASVSWAAQAEGVDPALSPRERDGGDSEASALTMRLVWRSAALDLLPPSTVAVATGRSLVWGPVHGIVRSHECALIAPVWQSGHPPLKTGTDLTELVETALAAETSNGAYVRPRGLARPSAPLEATAVIVPSLSSSRTSAELDALIGLSTPSADGQSASPNSPSEPSIPPPMTPPGTPPLSPPSPYTPTDGSSVTGSSASSERSSFDSCVSADGGSCGGGGGFPFVREHVRGGFERVAERWRCAAIVDFLAR